jgi:ribonucleotide reductase alpha subunit
MLPFTEDDYLGQTGERIVADRYLQKSHDKSTLTVGGFVMAVIDAKRAYHELARIIEVDYEHQMVKVELRDGHQQELPIDRVDPLKETAPREMWQRISHATASVTNDPAYWEKAFYELQNGWKYVAGGRINASMGTGAKTTSYNCFVIPSVGTTIRDYAKSFGQTLEIQARSGGVGMNLTLVPPQGTIVPQSDKSRKAELILALDVWHEDLFDFLDTEYPNSTKAVRVPSSFLEAVKSYAEWRFAFPDRESPMYDEQWDGDLKKWIDADHPVVYGTSLPAATIYDHIIESGAMIIQHGGLIGTVMNPGDSRGTIAERLGDMWEAMAEGHKVTMILSSLRPRYHYVKGVNGRSSGAYSWGILYDKGNQIFGDGFGPVGVAEIMSVGCELTLQGGSRRGALMIMLNDDHPDIFKFIAAKQTDGVITGANISVGISEEFMTAKERGDDWNLTFSDQLVRTVPAMEIWQAIVESAWQSAEPGVIFIGRYNQLSNSYYYNPIIATNPCFHPDTRITTSEGLIPIGKLYEQHGDQPFMVGVDRRVDGGSGLNFLQATVFPTGEKQTYKVTLANGMELRVTYDHKLMTTEGWKEAGTLTTNDYVMVQRGSGVFGNIHLGRESGKGLGERAMAKQVVPEIVFKADKDSTVAFLKGVFHVNVSVHPREIRLFGQSQSFLQDIQLLLLQFKIYSEITQNNLTIMNHSMYLFAKKIGFISPKIRIALDKMMEPSLENEGFASKVVSVEEDELIVVYDITEPETHSLIAGGVVAHNCGEQGLPAYGICNLGAVVLSKFAVPFGGETIEFEDYHKRDYIGAWFDKHFDRDKSDFLLTHIKWESLEKTTRMGIRFQDAVIDATYYPFEENRVNQRGERRVGLGIMGLHDLMLYLGIRYGSDESVRLIDVLMGMMAEWSYLESVELAKENGSFPNFDADKFLQSGYMEMMRSERPHVYDAIRRYGVRNVTTMTIAPTGTTGTMVGCSTGCEPYYAWTYYRNSRLGMFEENAAIVDEYRAVYGDGELPDYFVTAMDLTPAEHIRVQAALQKWVDSSISKTVNAPNHYTVDDTRELYDMAYDLGCKGVTIYRDGSRSEQVLSLKPSEEEKVSEKVSENQKVATVVNTVIEEKSYERKKRPNVLYGATYKKETPLGTAFITINDDPDEKAANEIFVNIGKAGTDVYAANEALGRAISLYLQDSQNPEKEAVLVKHFSGIGGHNSVGFGQNRITSVPDAIAKALIEHSESFPLRGNVELLDESGEVEFGDSSDGMLMMSLDVHSTHTHSHLRDMAVDKDLCPECHQHTLVRHGGCYECEACGYSKC